MMRTFTPGAGRPTLRTEPILKELLSRPTDEPTPRGTADQIFAADLAAAPERARRALAAERTKEAELDARVKAAESAVTEARTAVIDARVSGAPDKDATRAHDAAKAKLHEALEALEEQRKMVAEVEQRLVADVRAQRVVQAKADVASAHASFDAAFAQFRAGLVAIGTMAEAYQAESRALRAIAAGTGGGIVEPGAIPEAVGRFIVDVGDNSGQRQGLSVDAIVALLSRRPE